MGLLVCRAHKPAPTPCAATGAENDYADENHTLFRLTGRKIWADVVGVAGGGASYHCGCPGHHTSSTCAQLNKGKDVAKRDRQHTLDHSAGDLHNSKAIH
jgi:hypothetical protein